MIVREYALDQLDGKDIRVADTANRSSKTANVSRAAGPSNRVVPCGRVIDSSASANSRREDLVYDKDDQSCRSVASVDKTTAFLDSYSLKYNSGATCTTEA